VSGRVGAPWAQELLRIAGQCQLFHRTIDRYSDVKEWTVGMGARQTDRQRDKLTVWVFDLALLVLFSAPDHLIAHGIVWP
jgi:hypothetical protein